MLREKVHNTSDLVFALTGKFVEDPLTLCFFDLKGTDPSFVGSVNQEILLS